MTKLILILFSWFWWYKAVTTDDKFYYILCVIEVNTFILLDTLPNLIYRKIKHHEPNRS